jgi:hypothetical protein
MTSFSILKNDVISTKQIVKYSYSTMISLTIT